MCERFTGRNISVGSWERSCREARELKEHNSGLKLCEREWEGRKGKREEDGGGGAGLRWQCSFKRLWRGQQGVWAKVRNHIRDVNASLEQAHVSIPAALSLAEPSVHTPKTDVSQQHWGGFNHAPHYRLERCIFLKNNSNDIFLYVLKSLC